MKHPVRFDTWRGLALVAPEDAAIILSDANVSLPGLLANRSTPWGSETIGLGPGAFYAFPVGLGDPFKHPPWWGHGGKIPGTLNEQHNKCFRWVEDTVRRKAHISAWYLRGTLNCPPWPSSDACAPEYPAIHSAGGYAICVEKSLQLEFQAVSIAAGLPGSGVVNPLLLWVWDTKALWRFCGAPDARFGVLEASPAFLLGAMREQAAAALTT
jgi:hypothetical protein